MRLRNEAAAHEIFADNKGKRGPRNPSSCSTDGIARLKTAHALSVTAPIHPESWSEPPSSNDGVARQSPTGAAPPEIVHRRGGHQRRVTDWAFRVARDRDSRYYARLINPAGTEVWADADRYDTPGEAERAAARTREQIAAAEITNPSD
jgi:hypothetical protein